MYKEGDDIEKPQYSALMFMEDISMNTMFEIPHYVSGVSRNLLWILISIVRTKVRKTRQWLFIAKVMFNDRHCQNYSWRPLTFRGKARNVWSAAALFSVYNAGPHESRSAWMATNSLQWQITTNRGMSLTTREQKAVMTNFVLCRVLCYFLSHRK